jgi:NhaP-type Na+/H+ or K+/H+ antiporter
MAAGLRLPGIGLGIVAAAIGAASVLMGSSVPAVNMLVASAVLAVLGALLIAISLAAYLFEARDVATLQALAEETRANLAAARQLAARMRADREARLDRRHEPSD